MSHDKLFAIPAAARTNQAPRPNTASSAALTARRWLLALLITPLAAAPAEETVSFRCGLAIDAVIAEMDSQSENPITQEALSRIDEDNGQFVCRFTDDGKIYVRLQTLDMTPADNRLVISLDAATYRVLKTYYGR